MCMLKYFQLLNLGHATVRPSIRRTSEKEKDGFIKGVGGR